MHIQYDFVNQKKLYSDLIMCPQRIYRLYSRGNQGILIHLLTKPAGKGTMVALIN